MMVDVELVPMAASLLLDGVATAAGAAGQAVAASLEPASSSSPSRGDDPMKGLLAWPLPPAAPAASAALGQALVRVGPQARALRLEDIPVLMGILFLGALTDVLRRRAAVGL